jgi:hypothetical protein
MIRTAISPRFATKILEIAIGAAQISKSYSHHRIPVFDMELHTYLFGVKDCMTSIRPNLADGHRGLEGHLTSSGRPIEPAREWCLGRLSVAERWLGCSGCWNPVRFRGICGSDDTL